MGFVLFFNLKIALCSMTILTTLILPIQEHGISFHYFELFSISFISVLQFSPWLLGMVLIFISVMTEDVEIFFYVLVLSIDPLKYCSDLLSIFLLGWFFNILLCRIFTHSGYKSFVIYMI